MGNKTVFTNKWTNESKHPKLFLKLFSHYCLFHDTERGILLWHWSICTPICHWRNRLLSACIHLCFSVKMQYFKPNKTGNFSHENDRLVWLFLRCLFVCFFLKAIESLRWEPVFFIFLSLQRTQCRIHSNRPGVVSSGPDGIDGPLAEFQDIHWCTFYFKWEVGFWVRFLWELCRHGWVTVLPCEVE